MRAIPKNMKVIVFAVVALLLLWAGRNSVLEAIYDQAGKGIVNRAELRDHVKPGEFVRLSTLTSTRDGILCGLYPYQSSLSNDVAEPIRTKINDYLKEEKIHLGEGQWALLLENDAGIEMTLYDAHSDLVGATIHEIPSALKEKIPSKFIPLVCVDVEQAAFFKTFYNNRYYLFLGRIE